MTHVRRFLSTAGTDRARMFELAAVVFLWQAAVGIYFLSLVQQYLPNALDAGLAYPGYAMASYGVAKFLWQTPAGWLADRFGRRITMIAGTTLAAPILALMLQVPDERAFLAFSGLLGLSAATMWPAFMAHIGETTPHERRASTMSIVNLAQMAGIGAGTFVGVMMVDFVTYGAAFWACIGFNVLAMLVVMLHTDPARCGEAVADMAAGPARTARTCDEAAWTPSVLVLAVIVLFVTVGTSLHTPMVGAYAHDVLRVKLSTMAMLFPLPAAVAGLAMWKLHHLTDNFGRHVPLVTGLLVAAGSLFALTLTRDPFIVVNLVVLAGLAYAISIPAWSAAALDATDLGSRGLWLGALSAVQGLGVAGGQALGGAIGGVWGPLAPFKLAALLLLVAVALIATHHAAQTRQRRIAAAA